MKLSTEDFILLIEDSSIPQYVPRKNELDVANLETGNALWEFLELLKTKSTLNFYGL